MNPLTDSSTCYETEPLDALIRTHIVLNKGTEDELDCWGYRESTCKKLVFYILVLLSLGSLLLIVRWKPEWGCYLQSSRCTLTHAKTLLIKTKYQTISVIPVKLLSEPIEGVSYRPFDSGDTSGTYTNPGVSATVGAHSVSDDDEAFLSDSWLDTAVSGVRYFDFQRTRYLWDQKKHIFRKLEDLSSGTTCLTLHEKYQGLSQEQRIARIRLYGKNSMTIEVPSYWNLFINEVLNPFYIFQILSITLWCLDKYFYYASAIFLISTISITLSLRETRKQRVILRDMVSTEEAFIKVSTEAQEYVEIHENELVPGDVIVIPPNGCVMTCDAVLTAGTCIVNESMLTGESVPVTKTPLLHSEDEEMYSPDIHKRHTLFAGTHIVQTRYYGQAKVLAVVVRTGFNTSKGELVRAILFPKPLDFQFYRDAVRFILFLACIASVGMVYSLTTYIINDEPAMRTVLRVLDIVTIVVPPALPAAMTVGTVYAQNRLKKAGIFCISPPRINFCGRINVFCFDKTGTLTEDGLDMWGVVPVRDQSFCHHVSDPSTLERGPLLVCLASCHSLTIIDGELSGDPLDLIMFNAIKWHLEEPGTDTHKYDTIMPTVVKPYTSDTFLGEQHPFEVGIIRQFTFSSSSQRMSVITRTMGDNHMDLYCKGAPEKVASLCHPDSVPEEFHSILHGYSVQGFRVIALAYRSLDPKVTWHQVQRISRDKVEKDLTFLGLLVLQNQLKPQTAPVIKTLRQADIRSVMITGDMLQTAISVARNCGMVRRQDRVIIVQGHPPDKENSARIEWEEAEHATLDSADESGAETDLESSPLLMESSQISSAVERSAKGKTYSKLQIEDDLSCKKHLAINGKSFSVITNHFPELLPKICVEGTIFARMTPDQKCQLIENLQHLDYIVGMCGDGANDCEALKAAHAGISLSEAEASVAAPFTSRTNHIECVLTAIREGRSALVTSFGCFKYMALYSFIQFISVLILYTYLTNLSDFEYLHIDLVITTSVAILLGNTAAYEKLVRTKPPGSLMKQSNLLSIVAQVVVVACFQLFGFTYLLSQDFYKNTTVNNTLPCDFPSNESMDAGLMLGGDLKESQTWESTVMFLLSSYMYISVAFTFSRGPPFRKPIYTNVLFLVVLAALLAFSTFLLLAPQWWLIKFMNMKCLQDTPMEFRLVIFSFAMAFIIVSSFVEWIVVDTKTCKCLFSFIKRARGAKRAKYKQVHDEVLALDWPLVNQTTFPASSSSHMDTSEVVVDVYSSAVH